MTLLPVLLMPATLVAIAALCYRVLMPRVRRRELPAARASIRLLVVLIVVPPLLALMLFAGSFALPGDSVALARAIPIGTYAAYSVGLVCFIVANRSFQRMAP
jgi:hypothetical protein